MTTPSSPEVPFAQLLSSSLARNRRKCEFQPYQYPGSPGGHTKSPGSAISTSGTSSPFPDKLPVLEFRMSEAPKFIGYEHFLNYKWGSRVGSGSLTPNGWGSRLGSGTLTPNGGLSRLGSGTLTPNGEVSRLGSGTLTPNGEESEPASRDINILENQSSEVALLANSDQKLQNDGGVVDHRVSFELNDEDIPTCIVREPLPSPKIASSNLQEAITNQKDTMTENTDSRREHSDVESFNASPKKGDKCHQKHRTISLGSSKDFNFNSADKSTIDCEWWTNDKVVKNELGPQNNWTFFPMLQSGVS